MLLFCNVEVEGADSRRNESRPQPGYSADDHEPAERGNQHQTDKERGVEQVGLWITDGNQATINAVEHKFPASARQRCIKHKMDNILGYIPKKQQELVKPELKAIFYQANRQKADQEVAAFIEKYEPIYPTAIECLNRDLAACLSFYDFPKEHWKTIRTTNVIERMFVEVKRRSKKMGAAFRNENSCLLMFYAVVRGINFRRIPIPTKD